MPPSPASWEKEKWSEQVRKGSGVGRSCGVVQMTARAFKPKGAGAGDESHTGVVDVL